jgi:hypothetical protein
MAVGVALRKGEAVAGSDRCAARIVDQFAAPFEDDDELVLALVPVALRRPAAGRNDGMGDDEVGEAARPAEEAGHAAGDRSVVRDRIIAAVNGRDYGKVEPRHQPDSCAVPSLRVKRPA